MKHYRYFFIAFLFFSNAVFAASFSSYVCPNTYRDVKIGDDVATVTAACSQPTTVTTEQKQTNTPVKSTVWVYTLGSLNIKGISLFLPTLTVAFDNNQNVSSISREGLPITSGSGYCGMGKTINIGDNQSTVLAECGQPNYVNSQENTSSTTKNITVWTYNYGPYKPQVIFDFENGKLTKLSSGQLGS